MNDVVMMAGFAAVLVWSVVVGLVCLCLALAAVRTLLEQIGRGKIQRKGAKGAESHKGGLSGPEQRAAFFQGLEGGENASE